MSIITKGYVPENTKKCTSWAVKVFNEWKSSRIDDKKCPDNLLGLPVDSDLNYWMPLFINEVRKADGEPYPPRSINLLLARLQWHMLDLDHRSPKFLNRQNQVFKRL